MTIKETLDSLQDIIESVAVKMNGSVFNSYGVYEQVVVQMMEEFGGNRWINSEREVFGEPGGVKAFRAALCNKIKEKSNVRFEY